MRPSTEWNEVSKDTARLFRQHGVRTKRVISRNRREVVHLVPAWSLIIAGNNGHRLKRGRIRRALRRASRDAEFRAALQAARIANLEDAFLAQQEAEGGD